MPRKKDNYKQVEIQAAQILNRLAEAGKYEELSTEVWNIISFNASISEKSKLYHQKRTKDLKLEIKKLMDDREKSYTALEEFVKLGKS